MIKTTDGGQTWTSMSLAPHADTAVDVFFLDELHGFVAAGIGGLSSSGRVRVLETTDGGDTWTVRHTSSFTGAWGWKFSFPTPEVGYVSAEYLFAPTDGYVLKTTDGGQTWSEVLIPGGSSLQGVGFATPEVGWTSGREVSSVTTDGGQTWAQLDIEPGESEHINRFRFVGDTGYAAGHYIYKTDISAVAVEPGADPNATRLVQVAPNPAPGTLTATYHLARAGAVEVAVFDVLGRRIATLDAGLRPAGTNVAAWDPTAMRAHSGVYLVRLLTDDGVWTQPVTVLAP
jgi:hypothetical protein